MELFGVEVPIARNYKPDTKLAISWKRNLSNNMKGRDRGELGDWYGSELTMYLTDDYMNGFLYLIDTVTAREQVDITFNPGELVFGANVTHPSNMSCVIWKHGELRKENSKMYSMSIYVKAIDPPSLVGTPSISGLRLASDNFIASTSFDINFSDSYMGNIMFTDKATDIGIFKAKFWQTEAEMRAIRQYITTVARANIISFPSIPGIDSPWGPKQLGVTGNCVLTSWKDLGPKHYDYWELELEFSQVK